ncbi:MAG: hypothetical protein J0G95_10495 [Rhizobiales bacterium]|nr:hypothetical protein [Hyphomicrobiales bacterium]
MSLLIRLLLALAAPITALFVARDALNFDVVQTFVAVGLVAILCIVAAFWPWRSNKIEL